MSINWHLISYILVKGKSINQATAADKCQNEAINGAELFVIKWHLIGNKWALFSQIFIDIYWLF